MMSLRSIKIFFLLQGACLLFSCVPKRMTRSIVNQQEPVVVSSQELSMTYMPQHKRVPTHVVVNKTVRYSFSQHQIPESFTKEFVLNPTMFQASFVAHVQINGKTIRKYNAKTIHSSKTDRPVLSIVVPFLKPEEEVELISSYNWMDPRSLAPIFMEEPEATWTSKITIDVPYGVNLRYKAAYMGESLAVAPESIALEKAIWGTSDNRQGKRFVFEREFGFQNNAKKASNRQQLFVAFDAPAERDRKTIFENWDAVSSYFYNRIDRYDSPSNVIRDFSTAKTSNTSSDMEKIARVLSFLSNDIEKRRIFDAYQEQEAQPASRILQRRYGSPLEIVILGKAMLSSLNIDSNIVAVADPDQNPRIHDFFSPALFSKVILAISHNSETFYFDPLQKFDRFDQVPSTLQGQHALLVKPSNSQFFILPYEAAEKNRTNYFYNLTLNTLGTLEGSFSIEFDGIQADQARAIIAQQSTGLSASALQNKLQTGTTLRWQKASFNEHDDGLYISLSGNFSPRLLAHAPNRGFSLPIKEIFEPIFLPLINLAEQSHSSLSSLEATLHVPANFKLAQEKPFNFFLDHNGVRARFIVSFERNSVVFKGESMVSLPIKPDPDYKLALPEDQLTIVEISAQPEAPREASASNSQKNS